MKPRLLLVARERYRLPLSEPLRRKFDALDEQFELQVLATASRGSGGADDRFRLARQLPALDGPAFYGALPARAARAMRSFRPDAVLVQGAHETGAVLLGRRLAGRDVPVILDLHGNWRAATRLYGSPLRRALDSPADALARYAVRRADAIRTISGYTTSLVRELGRDSTAVFPAYVDLASFVEPPRVALPERPAALFVGVLERYKNVDGLVEAWRRAAERVPEATLRVVGRGREAKAVEDLVAQFPRQTTYTSHLTAPEVARALDESWALVLPSRSEGLPRVVMEAFCRGRGVVGSRAAGIPDLVEHGRNGLLVDPEDVDGLADALVRVVSDRPLAERLGDAAAADAPRWVSTPEEFARSLADLVRRARS